MPIHNRIADESPEITAWRRHLHTIPELLYDTVDTAAFIAGKLVEFGCDVVETGIGRTGVVGIVHGRSGPGGPMIGLRADMDALPIDEASGVAYASARPGSMHACGHDGHMAMLLGAARALARTRDFNGSVALIFQPAEEGGAGAKAMIEDGLFTRFPIGRVYGMHNLPGLAVGRFAMRDGPIMAATDEFAFAITGRGGHAAIPQKTADPILAGTALVSALQQIVSRNADPLDSLVVSVTEFHSGFAHNVIPDTARVSGTVRSLSAQTRDHVEARMGAIAEGIATVHGLSVTLTYRRNYPVTRNHAAEVAEAAKAAASVAGHDAVDLSCPPLMAAEDFSYMLEERPGAFIFIGNGPSAGLHNAAYDFADEAIAYGASYWIALVQRSLSGSDEAS
ncbi:amidohydrolase [Aureimonas sp. OT7]|uniref:M20 aminoacylase family protein n=1 Tax=Aureimonas sp. OT7 TaxID=2816454 RepID=UPI0017817558|nr:M20 aminoacylase family protein [Aureimonas sp. OT7]QOG07751.1 amidohydrolase [Aureimonas sp. OT7]